MIGGKSQPLIRKKKTSGEKGGGNETAQKKGKDLNKHREIKLE